MPSMTALYNGLPTLQQADDRFSSREQIFESVRALLANYDFQFGLCLVHAHCLLEEGEIMLSHGNISQPVLVAGVKEYYPERWLASGEPYEFTTRTTVAPPTELITAFKSIAGQLDMLGLYHVDKEETHCKMIEHTEGRKNILNPYTATDEATAPPVTVTGWDFSSVDPITLACKKVIVCDDYRTRSGEYYHKGTKSSLHWLTRDEA